METGGQTEHLEVRTPDGRALEVLVSGPKDGFPLVYHHGTPQGAVPYPLLDRAATQRHLRVVAYSRPGYGTSSPRPEGTVADDARDTATVLDALGLGEFVSIGWSGGGPRSLACGAVLPDRCLAATCGVGLVPPAEYDGDIRVGMGAENVVEYDAAYAGRESLRALLEQVAPPFANATAQEVADAFGSLTPPVDRAAMTGELAEYLAASLRHALLNGIQGWLDDDLTHIAPWGFEVASIRVPTAIWQGTEDTMVPLAHAQWLAAHVPGTRSHLEPGEGHLSLLHRLPDILDELGRIAGLTDASGGRSG